MVVAQEQLHGSFSSSCATQTGRGMVMTIYLKYNFYLFDLYPAFLLKEIYQRWLTAFKQDKTG